MAGPQRSGTLGGWLVRLGGGFANLYTTVIRGTPVLVQLLILYYGVFKTVPKEYALLVAGLSFGINSGAYVCEIVRAGIQSVEKGQTEAGRSLGLSSRQTMQLVVLPQAIKNILPTLFNEFITLLKETSVAGYIALTDLTRAGDVVRSRVWNITPLIISGLIYLILVILLTKVQGVLERRLGASDRRL
ncbi:MAG: amino acid ABC transporter permease [Oscillospiraceae bacterium]